MYHIWIRNTLIILSKRQMILSIWYVGVVSELITELSRSIYSSMECLKFAQHQSNVAIDSHVRFSHPIVRKRVKKIIHATQNRFT